MMSDRLKSEVIVAKLLSRLLDAGLKGETISSDQCDIEFDVDEDLFEKCVYWLRDEGIIRYSNLVPDTIDRQKVYFHDTVLSAYGFALMGQKFPSADSSQTVEQAAKQAGASGDGWLHAGTFLGGLIGGVVRSG